MRETRPITYNELISLVQLSYILGSIETIRQKNNSDVESARENAEKDVKEIVDDMWERLE